MELIAKDMTDDRIRAVSLYLASLRPEEVTPNEEPYPDLDEVVSDGPSGLFVPPEAEFVLANSVSRGEPE